MKLCTCKYSTFEKYQEPSYTLYPKAKRNYNISISPDYSKLNNKISNVKIQDFIINRANSNSFSNYINLNKSEYYFNGNEIGSFSSYNLNNKNPTKNIISVKNGTNNKKYVVKIKLYGNQIEPDEGDDISIKYKKYTNDSNKIKKIMRNSYSIKNITMPYDIDNNQKHVFKKSIKLKRYNGLMTDRFYHSDYIKTLNPTNKINHIEENNKLMNDQEILDYLNTNNTEKKKLIRKIIYQKLGNNKILNKTKKMWNKKNIHLNNSKSYSYINNNYNYFYDNQTSPSYVLKDKNDISYQNYNNYQRNTRITTNKNSLRPCCSNEIISYRDYKNENKSKRLKKVNSYNHSQKTHNNNTNIYPSQSRTNKIHKLKNGNTSGTRIIFLGNKSNLRNSDSANRISLKQKEKYTNNNIITVNSSNICKKNEISNEQNNKKEKEEKKTKFQIPNSFIHKKSNSLGVNTNIEDKNKIFIINKTVNEQFNKIKEEPKSDKDKLDISVQSINDSKIMELAKNFIKNEDNINLTEINQILNCKKGLV